MAAQKQQQKALSEEAKTDKATTDNTAKINILFNGKIIEAGSSVPSEMNVAQRKELMALGAL